VAGRIVIGIGDLRFRMDVVGVMVGYGYGCVVVPTIPAKCRQGHSLLLLLASAGESSVDLMVRYEGINMIWDFHVPATIQFLAFHVSALFTVKKSEEASDQYS